VDDTGRAGSEESDALDRGPAQETMKTTPSGEKVPEYGLVPPGVLADWNRYAYYFYGQAYYWAGLAGVARALQDIGDSGADSFLQEATAYHVDILAAYRWNQARMPVLPVSDGTWVPAYPSSLYAFGPTRNFSVTVNQQS